MSFLSPELLYAVGLLILGFVLILLEIFVIPGFNIFGILGFLTICTGVYVAHKLGPGYAIGVGALGVGGTVALVWLLVRRRAWQRLVLESKTTRDQGYDSSRADMDSLVGARGTALTPLRPAGRGQIGENIVDVVSEGDFVATGEEVEILEVAGNRVVVQRFIKEED